MKNLIVTKKYNGKKLNNFLLDTFNGLSQNTLYKALRKKDIRVNNVRVSDNVTIYENDDIKVFIIDEFLYSQKEIEIIYEDDNILIANKNKNIEVVGDYSLTSELQKKFTNLKDFPSPCHRIDRNTTGLVLFAKNQESLNILFEKFKQQEIEKHYLCTVYGIPTKKAATLTAYLFKDNKKSLVYISNTLQKGYSEIKTSYTVVSEDIKNNTSILDVVLHTGKTHQIRAHLAHIGFPILGDGKYGINEVNKKFGLKSQELCSYKMKFTFKTNAKHLDYLNGKEFKI